MYIFTRVCTTLGRLNEHHALNVDIKFVMLFNPFYFFLISMPEHEATRQFTCLEKTFSCSWGSQMVIISSFKL